MKVWCSHCGAPLVAPDAAIGKTVRCARCKKTFSLEVLELAEDPGVPTPPAATYAPAKQLRSVEPTPYATPVLTQAHRRCSHCGYQGFMPKKWGSWVVPVAIIVGIFTSGLGLLILLVPKKHHCPQCGTAFE